MRFFLLTVFVSGCAGLLPIPSVPSEDPVAPARFQHVALNLYRSAQPNIEQMSYLRDHYNVLVVVKLNGVEAREPEVGPEVISIPLSVTRAPTHAELEAAWHWIDQGLERGAVLVHCSHGEDRTGLVIAVWQMHHGVSWQEAFSDMVAHGWHPYGALWRAFAREAGWAR